MNKEPFLRDYQLEAVEKMSNGCILNGGVGSGKSRTGLYYYYTQCGGKRETHICEPMTNPVDLYIITTAMKRDSKEWECELANYVLSTIPEENVLNKSIKIVVDSWNNIKKYVGVRDCFFIFDEDRVTGSGAWVKAFLKIAKENQWIILSATPGDNWTDYIPVFLANGFYKNKTEFTNRHIVYKRYVKFPQVDRYLDEGHLLALRRRILVDMDFVRDVTQHHLDIYTKYDVFQYKEIIRNRWDIYKDEPIQQASSLCYVLRRLVNSDESRVTALLEIMEKHPRVIIFYNFDYELEMLSYIFSGSDPENYDESLIGYEVAEWNGHRHDPVPTSSRWVYLVQYTAGCEGWNCIRTNTIIFFSQNYSYKVMKQAAGRIDRMNTPYKDLYYYHLKSRSGIDLAISKKLGKKKKFNEKDWVGEW